MKNTIVINLYGGPGAGKSTIAAGLYFKFKLNEYHCELVRERAKELVWDKRYTDLEDQLYILGEQHHRIFSLYKKCDIIVSDSPIMMSSIYAPLDYPKSFHKMTYDMNKRFESINYFIRRPDKFTKEGRIHNLKESRKIDDKIMKMLKDYGIFFEMVDCSEEGVNQIFQNYVLYKKLKKGVY